MKEYEMINHVYELMIKPKIKTDNNGRKYIYEDDLIGIYHNEQEENLINTILKNYQIEKRIKEIKKEDRSPLVRDFDSGEVKGELLEEIDVPVYAEIQYDTFGNIIHEDYSKLDKFLENEFIPNNVRMMKKRKSEDEQKNLYPFIQLNKVVKLKLSELEFKHTLEYLKKIGIMVRGINSTVDSEFENYDYYRTYRSKMLPETLTNEELESKFLEYKKTNNPVIREQLILANMRLVPWIAYKYAMFYDDISVEEFESYGYEALIKAVDNYELRGNTFSSYACVYIRSAMKTAVSTTLLKYKGKRTDWDYKFARAKKIVEDEENERLIDNPELAERIADFMLINKDIKEENYAENLRRIRLLSTESLDELLDRGKIAREAEEFDLEYHNPEAYDHLLSLDVLNGYDLDEIKNTDYESIEEQLVSEDNILDKIDLINLKKDLNEVIKTLTDREQFVIRQRFGLDDGKVKSLDEVGELVGVTKERIRQIEAKALRKLRHPRRNKTIVGYVDDNPGPKTYY